MREVIQGMRLTLNDNFNINGISQYEIIEGINKTVWTPIIDHK